MDFAKSVLFKSYGIIYGNFISLIGTAIYMYDVLPTSYSYLHDDTDTVTFVLMAALVTVVSAVSGRSS